LAQSCDLLLPKRLADFSEIALSTYNVFFGVRFVGRASVFLMKAKSRQSHFLDDQDHTISRLIPHRQERALVLASHKDLESLKADIVEFLGPAVP
jgi:hypothetical protein